mmetsp:Transcript_86785/g.165893  ORF Transcript_86785/g.165893 Transcript_86785/m.165893 type:complete len:295 (-) Transcript_86785:75-959(-)
MGAVACCCSNRDDDMPDSMGQAMPRQLPGHASPRKSPRYPPTDNIDGCLLSPSQFAYPKYAAFIRDWEPYQQLGLFGLDRGRQERGELEAAFSVLSQFHHPSQGGSQDSFRRLFQAYEAIMKFKVSSGRYDEQLEYRSSSLQLSEDIVVELKSAFRRIDQDAKCYISMEGMAVILGSFRLNANPMEDAILKVGYKDWASVCKDDTMGFCLRFTDFLDWLVRKIIDADREEELLTAFENIDTNGDGVVDREEMCLGLAKYVDEDLNEQDVDELFDEADVNGDGVIQFEAFKRIFA